MTSSYAYDKADNRTNVTASFGSAAMFWRAGDFNGDGRDDILWRHNGGTFLDWLGTSNGGFVNNHSNTNVEVSTDWRIDNIGDFNGDGRSDLLWRHHDGSLNSWLGTASGGFTDNAANVLTNAGTEWTVVGTGDFSGDGRDDILWRHSSGTLTNWLGTANGGFVSNYPNAAWDVPADWRVAGVGDFNGDGLADFLWRHDSGTITPWLGTSGGGFVSNPNAAWDVPTDWNIVGVADFNGDGCANILWRYQTGTLTNWLGTTSGGFSQNWANVSNEVDLTWRVVGTGDYNGDGRNDILWRNNVGTVSNWLGTATGSFVNNEPNSLSEVPTEWHIEPR